MGNSSAAEDTGPDLPDWIDAMARSRAGILVLSALEATVLPIPLEAVLIPLMISRPNRALVLGFWAVVGSVLGSALLYGLGNLFAEPVVDPLVRALGQTENLKEIEETLTGDNLFWTAFLLSISPAPIQLASLGAGIVDGSLWLFLAGIAASRSVRYLGLAVLAMIIGPRLQRLHLPLWIVLGIPLAAAVAITILL